MTRRIALRRPRRIQVRFWKQGDSTGYIGHTTNISVTGMFLATSNPVPSGARVRLELTERERAFVLEGMVIHARRVRPELAKVNESGMGIRFLTVEELVRELMPGGVSFADELPPGEFVPYVPTASASTSSTGSAAQDSPVSAAGTAGSWPSAQPDPATSAHSGAPPRRPVAPEPAPPAQAPPPRTPAPPPVSGGTQQAPGPAFFGSAPPVGGSGTFAVRFGSAQEFLDVYRRDILNGGLFVSTLYPARLQETVIVELHLPLSGEAPVSIRARVVQRFEPNPGDLSPNLLAGMGLELLDQPKIVEAMLPLIARLVSA
jgi:hypothetical protein